MLRLFGATLCLLVVTEIILSLSFLAGYAWIGGVVLGLLFAAAVLVLLILPWVGELRVDYDSAARQLKVSASWWASARVRFAEPTELRLRIFGLPCRRKLEKSAAPPDRPRVDLRRWAWEQRRDLLHLATVALPACGELILHTEQLAVVVNAPAQADVVDQIIAGMIGQRTLGPVSLQVRPEGDRRLQVCYRVGFATAAGVALCLLLQGRALRLARSLRAAGKRQ